jgi:hypothetical protein
MLGSQRTSSTILAIAAGAALAVACYLLFFSPAVKDWRDHIEECERVIINSSSVADVAATPPGETQGSIEAAKAAGRRRSVASAPGIDRQSVTPPPAPKPRDRLAANVERMRESSLAVAVLPKAEFIEALRAADVKFFPLGAKTGRAPTLDELELAHRACLEVMCFKEATWLARVRKNRKQQLDAPEAEEKALDELIFELLPDFVDGIKSGRIPVRIRQRSDRHFESWSNVYQDVSKKELTFRFQNGPLAFEFQLLHAAVGDPELWDRLWAYRRR